MFKRTVIAASVSLLAFGAHAESVNSWGAWNAPINGAGPAINPGGVGGSSLVQPALQPGNGELTRAVIGNVIPAAVPSGPTNFVNNGNWVGYTASSEYGPTGATFVTTNTWERTQVINTLPQVFLLGQSVPAPDPQIAALQAQGYVFRSYVGWVLTYTTSDTVVENGYVGGKAGTIVHQILPNGQPAGTSSGVRYFGGEVIQNATLDGSTAEVRKSVVFDFPALNNNFWWSNDRVTIDGVFAGFVAGQPTPLAEIGTLRAGNVSANYVGSAIGFGQAINLGVNFGTGTWNGAWTGGNIQRTNSTLLGGDSFTATGTISGNNLNGAASGVGILSGRVDATFAGPMAATVIGKTDLNIARLGGGAARITDVFSASVPVSRTGAGNNITAGAINNESGVNITAGFGYSTSGGYFNNPQLISTQRSMLINGVSYPVPPGR